MIKRVFITKDLSEDKLISWLKVIVDGIAFP